jgi:hypothetical protein
VTGDSESPLSAYWSLRRAWGLLVGTVGLVVAGGLLVTGILPATPENLALVGAVLVLMLLPVYRAL